MSESTSIASPPPQPAPPVAAEARPSRRGPRWWLPGLLVGLPVALVAAWIAWPRPTPPEGSHRVQAVIDLPDAGEFGFAAPEESAQEYAFILQSRDLCQRTVNDPAVMNLATITALDDPAAFLVSRVRVEVVRPAILAVSLTGGNPDELKVVIDTLVKKFVEDANARMRLRGDERVRRLEKTEQQLKDDLENLRRREQLLSQSGGAGGETAEKRQADIRGQVARLSAELERDRETVLGLEAELGQAKKAAGQPPAPEPHEVARLVDGDPRVSTLVTDRAAAFSAYQKARQAGGDEGMAKDARTAAERSDKAVAAAREAVRPEIEAALKAAAAARLGRTVAELESRLAVATDRRKAHLNFRDVLTKSLAGVAGGESDLRSLRDSAAPLQEMLGRLQRDLVQVRVQRDMVIRTKQREVAQVERLPTEPLTPRLLAAAGPAGTAFAAAFVLTTLFRLTGLLFRVLHRAA